MKIAYCLLLCVAFTACGPKSNKEKAMEVVIANLKTSLPESAHYNPLNFGALGTASLPYEETSQYLDHKKLMNQYSDSILLLQKMITADATAAGYKERLQQLQDSSAAKSERNKIAKQSYIPEKLFKLTHAYTVDDKDDIEHKTESEFFIDKELTRVVKMHKVY